MGLQDLLEARRDAAAIAGSFDDVETFSETISKRTSCD